MNVGAPCWSILTKGAGVAQLVQQLVTGWTVGVRILVGAGDSAFLQNIQTGSGAHSTSYSVGTGVISCWYIGCSVKLTTHLHLVPRLKMSGSIPSTSLYAFKAWAFVQCLRCTKSESRHALIPDQTEQCVCACVFVEMGIICVLQYKCLNFYEFLIHT